jgi:C4-type Zn-finger protein
MMTEQAELTYEQKQDYLNENGTKCPYCQSTQLNGEQFDVNAGIATQNVECMSCGEYWKDVYRLDNIRET